MQVRRIDFSENRAVYFLLPDRGRIAAGQQHLETLRREIENPVSRANQAVWRIKPVIGRNPVNAENIWTAGLVSQPADSGVLKHQSGIAARSAANHATISKILEVGL